MKGLTNEQIENLVEMLRVIRTNLLEDVNAEPAPERKRHGTA